MILKQPSMLQGGLSAYQLEGLRWMLSLFDKNLNGILVDETRLDRIVQIISLIAYLMENENVTGPHLIVTPKALLSDWMTGFATWAPRVATVCYDGCFEERKAPRDACLGEFNVLLTHHDMITTEKTFLKQISWYYMILDEGDQLKTPIESGYKMRRTVLLTRNPTMYSLRELWSLLYFVVPEIFSSEHHGRREPRVEKRSPAHVAFGQRSETSTPLSTWGKPKEGSVSKTGELPLQDSSRGNKPITTSSLSTAATDQARGGPIGHVNTSRQQLEKEYIEPWDYNSLYPVTLPLRRPYSGDPELLNEAEFGPGAAATEYDEDLTNSAAELELLDVNEDAQMLFFQLPPKLPIVKNRPGADSGIDISKTSKIENALHTGRREETARSSKPMEIIASTKARGKEKVDNVDLGVSPTARGMDIAGKSMFSRKRTENLEDLPAGYMGKMLVYKSGAIKLKLGDILYDVSAGSNCTFAEDVVAINTGDKEFCRLGEIKKRAIVTPDQSLFDDVNDLS